VYGATEVVYRRMLKSLVQVESHQDKIALEKIQVVSTRVKTIKLEILLRKIAIRVHALKMVM
jgi:hypothetical protein